MKKYTEPMFESRYYHVFNRTINGEPMFVNPANYIYFLEKIYFHLSPVSEILCYCLLQNHFHFLMRTKSYEEILSSLGNMGNDKSAEYLISKQFSHFFNGYAQAFNKMFNRTGGLFEEPFRRKEIIEDEQLTSTILYIHLNTVRHKLDIDYTKYPYSSYSIILNSSDNTDIVKWFGNIEEFTRVHKIKAALY